MPTLRGGRAFRVGSQGRRHQKPGRFPFTRGDFPPEDLGRGYPARSMDGVSEDFSGLPRPRGAGRDTRSIGRNRGHFTRVAVVGGFTIALLLTAMALIVLFAPTPYLGASHGALAHSVGGGSAKGCHPAGDIWVCRTTQSGTAARYDIKVDWAGCWKGQLAGPPPARGIAPSRISGCVSLVDHFTAD